MNLSLTQVASRREQTYTAWQVFHWGMSFVAFEYDAKGYTGLWGYVDGYGKVPAEPKMDDTLRKGRRP